MELRDILAWIDRRLEVKKLSAHKASKLAGHDYAIQNMRKTLKNGRGSFPKAKTLSDLARVLGEPPAGLLGPLTHEPLPADIEARLQNRLTQIELEAAEIRTALDVIRQYGRQAG